MCVFHIYLSSAVDFNYEKVLFDRHQALNLIYWSIIKSPFTNSENAELDFFITHHEL